LGYKVGCVSPVIQDQFGLEQPVYGYLWRSEQYRSGSRVRASAFANLAVEGEIALRLRAEIPLAGAGAGLAALGEYVECWYPVIELHNYCFRGPMATSQELAAGNAMHSGLVGVGEEGRPGLVRAALGTLKELDYTEIRVTVDEEVVEVANAAALPGGPLGSLRWLVGALAKRKETLKAGMVVLTGSPGRLIPVQPGNRVTVTSARQAVELFVI
jgi:2-keto-4-pentenoate hydratase